MSVRFLWGVCILAQTVAPRSSGLRGRALAYTCLGQAIKRKCTLPGAALHGLSFAVAHAVVP